MFRGSLLNRDQEQYGAGVASFTELLRRAGVALSRAISFLGGAIFSLLPGSELSFLRRS
jgi:hypothetical protein